MNERSQHWYIIGPSGGVGARRPVSWRRFGAQFVLWRSSTGALVCMADRCPHRGAALSSGKVREGTRLQCPYHGFEYERDGRCVKMPCEQGRRIPAGMQVQTYPVCESQGWIWLWRGVLGEALPAPPVVDGLERYHCSMASVVMRGHHTRVLEGTIDYAHLPYVHRRSIGRFIKSGRLDVVCTRTATGLTSTLLEHERGNRTDIHYPNWWINWVGDRLMMDSAFVPVDEDHTEVYIRWGHRFTNLPLLRSFTSWIGVRMALAVLREDAVVVEGQTPTSSDDAAADLLVASDGAIAMYRKLRREALDGGVKLPQLSGGKEHVQPPDGPGAGASLASTEDQVPEPESRGRRDAG